MSLRKIKKITASLPFYTLSSSVLAQSPTDTPTPIKTAADAGAIEGIPKINLITILSFAVKLFFTIAALVALYHLIMGAFQWISSGGDKDAIGEARNKIQAAVVGLVMIVAILSIAYTLEQFVFRENICFGISCDIKIPGLLEQLDPGAGNPANIDWGAPE